MPRLLSQTEVKLEWQDLQRWRQRPVPQTRRTPGVHLSGIIKAVMKSLGRLKEWQDLEEDEMPLNVAMGVMWEQWCMGLPDMVDVEWQPGEIEKDGVYMSPDGLAWSTLKRQISTYRPGVDKPEDWIHRYREEEVEVLELQECKATWKSEREYEKDITKHTSWMWQLAGYLCGFGVDPAVARLHVLWVNGMYKPPRPRYMRYRIGFEQAELEQFWENVVLKNKGLAEAEQGGQG